MAEDTDAEIANLRARLAALEGNNPIAPPAPTTELSSPARPKRPSRVPMLLLVLFGLVVLLAVVIGSQQGGGGDQAGGASNSASTDAQNPEQKKNFMAIPADMARIYDALPDPTGIKWGTVTGDRNGTTICGSVNAHNAFGGFTGQRHFIFDEAVGDPGVPLGGGAYLHWEGRAGFAREWRRLCQGDPNAVTVDGDLLAGQVVALAPLERESGQ